jgi:cell division septation protein DedD
VAAPIHDDGFHEIQLNGKQLVFLFMAATVVSVVIFLSGVMVGRGVRAERAQMAQSEVSQEAPSADIVARTPPPLTTVEAAVDPNTPPPDPVDEDLSYAQRLDTPGSAADRPSPKPAAPEPAPETEPQPAAATRPETKKPEPAPKAAAPPKAAPAPKAEPPAPAPVPAAVSPAPGPGSGYAVQVAALNKRSEADAIAKRLTSKGYAAYVQVPPNGATSIFRVRVGTFKTRREAETVAAKLQKEEQFKPWITR